jgi:hypothetical protein
VEVPECRAARGIRYPAGLIVFCLLLCQCATRSDQRAKAIWIKAHWKWILKLWRRAKGVEPSGSCTISQSCLSRFLAAFDGGVLASLMATFEQQHFLQEWKEYVKKGKKRNQEKKANGRRRGKIRRHTFRPALKKTPQYCLDGKSRAGCTSALTGRTEIDLTLLSPDTMQVFAVRTLADKEGEQTAAQQMIGDEGTKLPRGVFTGDAGITCPGVVSAAMAAGHSYILGIKGNAGHVFAAIERYPWDDVPDTDLFFNEGHGREEIRSIKSVPISAFGSCDLFAKYEGSSVVFEVCADNHLVKEDIYSTETRYFIGDRWAAGLTAHEAITYIRDHWQQESYHWVKDVVLGEDSCPHKSNRGSRTLGVLRSMTVRLGRSLFGSTKRFVDHFVAEPEKISKM